MGISVECGTAKAPSGAAAGSSDSEGIVRHRHHDQIGTHRAHRAKAIAACVSGHRARRENGARAHGRSPGEWRAHRNSRLRQFFFAFSPWSCGGETPRPVRRYLYRPSTFHTSSPAKSCVNASTAAVRHLRAARRQRRQTSRAESTEHCAGAGHRSVKLFERFTYTIGCPSALESLQLPVEVGIGAL